MAGNVEALRRGVRPHGFRVFGSVVIFGKCRRILGALDKDRDGSYRIPIPNNVLQWANFAFHTIEENLYADEECIAEMLAEGPREFRVVKCRNPDLIQDFLIDPDHDPFKGPVMLTWEDVVMLRLSGHEPPWHTILKN